MSQRKRNRLTLDFSILILTVSSFFTFNFLPCSGQNIRRVNTENLQQNGAQTESLGIGDVNQRQMKDCPTDVLKIKCSLNNNKDADCNDYINNDPVCNLYVKYTFKWCNTHQNDTLVLDAQKSSIKMYINNNMTVKFFVENGNSNKIGPCQCRKKVLYQQMSTCKWSVSLQIKGNAISAAGTKSAAYSYKYAPIAIKTLQPTPTTTSQPISTATCKMNEKPVSSISCVTSSQEKCNEIVYNPLKCEIVSFIYTFKVCNDGINADMILSWAQAKVYGNKKVLNKINDGTPLLFQQCRNQKLTEQLNTCDKSLEDNMKVRMKVIMNVDSEKKGKKCHSYLSFKYPLPLVPSSSPSDMPTLITSPVPSVPAAPPTFKPSARPTFKPSAPPTFKPSARPTFKPSAPPTFKPSAPPTFKPTAPPTFKPSASPTFKPSLPPQESSTPCLSNTIDCFVMDTNTPCDNAIIISESCSLKLKFDLKSCFYGQSPLSVKITSSITKYNGKIIKLTEIENQMSLKYGECEHHNFTKVVNGCLSEPIHINHNRGGFVTNGSKGKWCFEHAYKNFTVTARVKTGLPTLTPTSPPSTNPTRSPTTNPTQSPTTNPTLLPTTNPTRSPSTNPSQSPTLTTNPTLAPSTISPTRTQNCVGFSDKTRKVEILKKLSSIYNNLADVSLESYSTIPPPQSSALHWLLIEDGAYTCPNDPNLSQRYALAVFYFSTNGDTWKACNRISLGTCDPKLYQIDNDPKKVEWSNETWLSGSHECTWGGLSCTNKNDIKILDRIDLDSNNVTGTIPFEIEEFSNIRYFIIEGAENSTKYIEGVGGLQGSIPAQLGSLKNLLFIDLNYNSLTGSIPNQIFSLSYLKILDLNDNKLTGTLETEIENLDQLVMLSLDNNALSGTIPPQLGDLTKLKGASFAGNDFTGNIPSELCARSILVLPSCPHNFRIG